MRKSNMQAELTQQIHLVRIRWWMKYNTKCVDWLLYVNIFPLHDRRIEGGIGCWWLLATVFVLVASTPHLGAFEARGTLAG